jgi:hypothetical protein
VITTLGRRFSVGEKGGNEMKYGKTFLVVAFLLLFLPAGVLADSPEDLEIPRTQLRDAIHTQETHTDSLMLDPNVVGTAVGVGAHGHGVVKIFVKDARKGGLPGALDGIPVEVEETGEIVALSCRQTWCDRPVPIGVSTGHPLVTAGTIGARVKDSLSNVYALSNNHVYANSNNASIGDSALQPGPYDGGVDPRDAIGTLDDFQWIYFCNPYPTNCPNNTIDAAIASSSTVNLGNATPSDGYGLPKKETAQASVGLRVMKYGRTTGRTKGRIYAINATVNVNYGTGIARFVNQIIITPGSFSAGGDSGSLIVVERGSNTRRPVGLLFAGSSSVTIANPIGSVLTRFGVDIDGE